ncbi:N-acetyltransferase 10 [Nematocida sp. AWRm80]|nr:N-acetyltransferase 10 [Nematocida sp. AWRm80]
MTSSKEKVDKRLLELLENSIKHNHRTVIGVNGKVKDVAHYIHALLTRYTIRPRVLWVYEKTLETKQEKIGRAKKKRSGGDTSLNNFESFIVNTEIVYAFHNEAERVLGTTTDLCVLQDFSQIKANTLASVVESVKGGGIILLSVQETDSIYMQRIYRLLLLANNYAIIDTEMNVIKAPELKRVNEKENIEETQKKVSEAAERIKQEANPLNPLSVISAQSTSLLLQQCRTADQANALLKLSTVLETRSTIAVTADRGRGKSAALGLAVALAVTKGLNDILVVSPYISNVQTLFGFVVQGLNCNRYKEQIDYHIEYSRTNKRMIEKIVISKTHYQTVKFSLPQKLLYSPSLLVVDEAAAIPLTILKEMVGMYPTLLSSTTAGYEGTGRALSLKFFKTIKPEIVHIEEPIRYGKEDPVEAWLNASLSLAPEIPKMVSFPKQERCQIYAINKNLLFSGNSETEKVLKSLASILLSGHYKNSPNDLQILADNEYHTLIVLLTDEGRVLGLAQCVQEGNKSIGEPVTEAHKQRYNEKRMEEGELIPWTLSEYYLDLSVFNLAGIRIVRIAIHPDAHSMGYGSYLVNQIIKNAQTRSVNPSSIPAVFQPLSLGAADYVGVSFGVTQRLLDFWQRQEMKPVYLKHTLCKSTGEHSLVMIRPITKAGEEKASIYNRQFVQRFIELLPGCFSTVPSILAMQLITPQHNNPLVFSADQLKRLKQYTLSNIDLRLIQDILPMLAKSSLLSTGCALSPTQKVLLLALGLQHKQASSVLAELNLPQTQTHMLLAKGIAILTDSNRTEYTLTE